jgi:prophage maintenance system killer protein
MPHLFVDGKLNGLMIEADEPEVVRVVLAIAAGELDESGFTNWLTDHTIAA